MNRMYTVTARNAAGQSVWTVRGVAETAAEAMTRAARTYRQSRYAQSVTWNAVADDEG